LYPKKQGMLPTLAVMNLKTTGAIFKNPRSPPVQPYCRIPCQPVQVYPQTNVLQNNIFANYETLKEG
jgi:hypothetical protein